jgi:hypothetical protein
MSTEKRLVQIRLNPKVYEELKKLCKAEGRSITNMVERMVDQGITAIKKSMKAFDQAR